MCAPKKRVGVIDLGSNSLKILVAEVSKKIAQTKIRENEIRGNDVEISALKEGFAEIRLLGNDEISAEKILAGTAAIKNFLSEIRRFRAEKIALVGTSVFRSAKNSAAFLAKIFEETGQKIRVLLGAEEALAIARGIATDPFVQAEIARAGTPPSIFDLGGGSLEFIAVSLQKNRRGNAEIFVESFPLGAVRLTKEFFENADEILPRERLAALRRAIRERAGTRLLERFFANSPAVISGGTSAILAKILGNENAAGMSISSQNLEEILAEISSRKREERLKKFPGIPPERADIFPAALAVFCEISRLLGNAEFLLSSRNLRFGIAAEIAFL